METIGFAYQLTGRRELGEHGAKLLMATATKYPITRKEVAKGFAGGRGDLMHGLALGVDLLSEVLSDADRRILAEGCAAHIEHFRVEFENPKASTVKGEVFDITGTFISNLTEEQWDAASGWTLSWDGKNDQGSDVPSGIYIYQIRIEAEGKVINGTVVVAR